MLFPPNFIVKHIMVWHKTGNFLILCFVYESAPCKLKVKVGLINGYEMKWFCHVFVKYFVIIETTET